MAVEKLDRASRHAARGTRNSGEVVKDAAWPRQTERQPDCRESQRTNGNNKPDQFVVRLAWTKLSPAQLHPMATLMMRAAHGPPSANHDSKKQSATAADNQGKKYREHCPARIGFMGPGQADAGGNDSPHGRD